MFRMLRIRPPNGWAAVGWELAIVTAGVLIALWAQQWVNERDWASRVDSSRSALRDELAQHYRWSVEWRTIAPCLITQIERLQQTVLTSGAVLQPAPVFTEGNFSYVIRLPSKEYTRSAYDAAISDGVAPRFDPAFRSQLNEHYAKIDFMIVMTRQNGDDYQQLFGLSRALPLNPSVRFELLRILDSLRGRVEFMDLVSGQLIDHVARMGVVPPAAEVRRDVERFGTFRFCQARRLPLRSSEEARVPVPS